MARPLKERRGELPSAVAALRHHIGETQQQFAARLGLAITSIARYETQRAPSGDVLGRLVDLADEVGRADLAGIFRQALTVELGSWQPSQVELDVTPRSDEEKLWTCALLGVLRNPGYAASQAGILTYLREPAERCIENLNLALRQKRLGEEAECMLRDGINPAEIATRLGVPESDVRYFSALRKMRSAPAFRPSVNDPSDQAAVDAINTRLSEMQSGDPAPTDLPDWALRAEDKPE